MAIKTGTAPRKVSVTFKPSFPPDMDAKPVDSILPPPPGETVI